MEKQYYQNTEVGLIPEDWEVRILEDLTSKIGSGITPRGGVTVYKDEGRPFLRSQNIGWGSLKLDDIKYINDEIHLTFPNTEVKLNDVFLNISGASIGRSSYATKLLIGGNVNQHVCIIRTEAKKLNYLFLNKVLLSSIGQKQIDSFQSGGNREGLNIGQIRTFKIPLHPTLEEQKSIATALTDVDELISGLEKLISKKKDIKQGAMQQLLTPPHEGGKRLPGFSGEWTENKLGEFCKITTGKLDANAMVEDGDYRFYTCAKTFYQIDNYAFDTEALLVSGNGANVGYIHYYKGKFNAYQRTYVLDDFKTNIHFMKCLLDKYLAQRIDSEKNEGNTPYIKMDTLTEMRINIPSCKSEQGLIAKMLFEIDSEITQIELKKEKYQAIKQGMMQELLTGKIRLV